MKTKSKENEKLYKTFCKNVIKILWDCEIDYQEMADNWKSLAQEEIRIQRRLTRKLVELGITDKELEEITGQTIIYND